MLRASGSKSMLDSSSESESEEVFKKKGSPRKKVKSENGANQDQKSFSINKGYADRYNSWRNLEEMQKLKDRLKIKDISELDEDDSESSSEEEEEWSPEKEKAFFKTLACLKKKDPKIYNDQFGFFKGVGEDTEAGTSEKGGTGEKQKKSKAKPFTVRDHERVVIMGKGGQLSDEDEEGAQANQGHLPKSYHEQLQSIKTEFSKAAKKIDSSDEEDEDDTLLGSNLLKKRELQAGEEEKDQEQYRLWLKGELDKVGKTKLSKDDEKELKSLREYWTDDKLDEGEKFLRDYILNKKYIDPLKNDGADYIPSYNEVVHDDDELSEDEKFEANREEFEHKYNFRFEEPDQEFIKRYPRTIQDSLRREDTKRKEQREKTKERKEETISKKREEVQRLKAMKRKEIMDKIQKLHEISGNPDLELNEMDIDGDFDPEEYDRRMQEIFNDEYYKEGGDDSKPEFPFDEEIDGDREENWDEWVPVREAKTAKKGKSESDDEDDEEEEEQDIDQGSSERSRRKKSAQDEIIEATKGRRGRRKRSAFLDALEKEKPKFDPKVHKSFEEYFEEYYKLDFEDVVGGDLKCRFKYHKTTPNDFGLSVDEILKADDRELNQWASLKKTFQYRAANEEEYEVKAYQRKSERQDLKKRILLSVYQPQPDGAMEEDEDTMETGEDPSETPKKKKKKKKNKNKTENSSAVEENEEVEKLEIKNSPASSPQKFAESSSISSPKKKKRMDTNGVSVTSSSTTSALHQPSLSTKLSKRQRKNQKKKLLAGEGEEITSSNSNNSPTKTKVVQNGDTDNSKKHKNKSKGAKRKHESHEATKMPVDEERLRAYGINPTKFKKRMKYGASVEKS